MSAKRRKYEIEQPIGKGGMGEVFRAIYRGALGFKARVALKQLPSDKAKNHDARVMLQQEAELCAALEHPNIVPVLDFDQDSAGDVRLIMMYIDGVNLHDLLESGPLPIPVIEHIVSSVLSGLAYIHKRGIIHRDITLGNILVSRAGAVRIADFGLATYAQVYNLAAFHSGGTVGYMSPEALKNEPLDPRSDLFSLGAVLYRLLTGQAAFPATSTLERMAQTLCQTPDPPHVVCPDVPKELSELTMRLLAPCQEDRFPSAIEALDALMPPSKYGSEDLAALIEERHEQGRLDLPPLENEFKSGEPDAANGSESSDEFAKRATMPHPGPMPRPRPGLIVDPAVVARALAEAEAIPRWVTQDAEIALEQPGAASEAIETSEAIEAPEPPEPTMPLPGLGLDPAVVARALAEAEEAIPRRGTQDTEIALEQPEAASEAIEAPEAPGDAVKAPRARRARLHPWLRMYFAGMAVASLLIWGVVGLRALRSPVAQQQAPRHVEVAKHEIDRSVAPGPSKVAEPVRTPRHSPMEYSDEKNSRNVSARGKRDHPARPSTPVSGPDRPEEPIAYTETEGNEASDTKPMDTPMAENGARSIEDPATLDPFKRFAGPMGETLPGEVVMQP